jgi:hypothetical protein
MDAEVSTHTFLTMIIEESVSCPSNVTLVFLFVRKFVSQLCTGPLIPYWSNLCSSFLWGAVSKAFKSSVRLFADDCLLYREINSQNDHNKLQKDLENLEKWAENWGMRFNATKCYSQAIYVP